MVVVGGLAERSLDWVRGQSVVREQEVGVLGVSRVNILSLLLIGFRPELFRYITNSYIANYKTAS